MAKVDQAIGMWVRNPNNQSGLHPRFLGTRDSIGLGLALSRYVAGIHDVMKHFEIVLGFTVTNGRYARVAQITERYCMAPPPHPPVGSDKSPFDVNTSDSTHTHTSPEHGNGGHLGKEMFDRYDRIKRLSSVSLERIWGCAATPINESHRGQHSAPALT